MTQRRCVDDRVSGVTVRVGLTLVHRSAGWVVGRGGSRTCSTRTRLAARTASVPLQATPSSPARYPPWRRPLSAEKLVRLNPSRFAHAQCGEQPRTTNTQSGPHVHRGAAVALLLSWCWWWRNPQVRCLAGPDARGCGFSGRRVLQWVLDHTDDASHTARLSS